MIRDSGRHIGEVLAAAVNLLNPALVVVAGDMVGAYDIFVAGLRETLYGNATALATRALQVVPSTYGDRSGVIGSATMVLDHVLSPAAIDALIDSQLGDHVLPELLEVADLVVERLGVRATM